MCKLIVIIDGIVFFIGRIYRFGNKKVKVWVNFFIIIFRYLFGEFMFFIFLNLDWVELEVVVFGCGY